MISEKELLAIPDENFNPALRLMAANNLATSLSFCTERKYLEAGNSQVQYVADDVLQGTLATFWIKLQQVGKPLSDSTEDCFTAMQKILSSCFLPERTQLIFLLKCEKGISSLYIGIRPLCKDALPNDFDESFVSFIKGVWPGVDVECCEKKDQDFLQSNFEKDSDNRYRSVLAITGIPSFESQYKNIYPATIDKLVAGSHGKNFTYLVVANPIAASEVDDMLYQCRELNGQAESLKSFNFSENRSSSYAHQDGKSSSISEKDLSSKKAKWLLGLGGAAAIAGTVMSFIPKTSHAGMAIAGLGNMATSFIPQRTDGETESDTYTKSQAETISSNIVNKQIEAVSEHLFYHSKRFETGKAIGMWSVGAYLLGLDSADLQPVAMQLSSILSGQESIFEPIRVHDISHIENLKKKDTFGKLSIPSIRVKYGNKIVPHPFGRHFTNFNTVLTTKELSYLVNFPLRSVPGISVVDSAPEFSLNPPALKENEEVIDFGHLLYGGSETDMPYHLPISALAKHTLLSGINGTGKTNTVQAILNAVSQCEQKIPFLVIEPAKTEYVDWAIEYNKEHPNRQIKIFIPGCKAYRDRTNRKIVETSQLCLNPFEPVWLSEEQDPNILTHIDRLKSTFAAAFPMYDILPVLLEDLVYSLYQSPSTNWIGKDASPVYGKTLSPTLTGMAANVDKVIEAHGYERRVSDNMKACLNTRIASLRRGWKKDMLDTLHSTPWEELFGQPCVINLSYVGDDVDKSFFMSLILQFLYEYRAAQAECGNIDFNSNDCRHLTVIEEAHRVMQKCEKTDELQYRTAMMFSNMLSEIRAYGEGMLLVDQVPTRLIPDAIKNTNIKITHRVVAEDDCKAIAESMGLSKEQRPIIPKLLVGQCLVSTALSADKHWIKVNKVK